MLKATNRNALIVKHCETAPTDAIVVKGPLTDEEDWRGSVVTALYTAEEILAVPVPPDGCSDGFPGGTIGDFFHGMLLRIWNDPDDFSGKRPYGNSGWPFDLYAALVRAEMISGSFDEWGYIEECDDEMGDRLITLALHGSRLVARVTCPYDADGDGDCHPCRPEGYPEGLEAVFLPVAVVDRMAVSRNTADDSYEPEFAARKAQARRGMAERLSRALDIPPELLDSPVSNHWSARDPFAGSDLADFFEPFVVEVTYGCRTTVAHWDGEHWVVEDVDPPSNL